MPDAARPRIADLFSGAGGAAMGLHRAGFEVVGFDIEPQPHYPFEFHQADALTVDLRGYDAVWASPPCQYYSRLRYLPWLRGREYWRSIPPTRDSILASGLPYIIENVDDASWDMPDSIYLCGQMFGLPLFRHRRFESSVLLLQPAHQKHRGVIVHGRASLAQRQHGMGGINAWNGVAGHQAGVKRPRAMMGIDWMTGAELTQAVPPAYSEFLGRQLIKYVVADL